VGLGQVHKNTNSHCMEYADVRSKRDNYRADWVLLQVEQNTPNANKIKRYGNNMTEALIAIALKNKVLAGIECELNLPVKDGTTFEYTFIMNKRKDHIRLGTPAGAEKAPLQCMA